MRRTLNATLATALALLLAAPAAAETLLIGNKGEDTLSLVALSSGEELARLPTGKMPHEIAVSPDGKQAAVVAYGGTTIDVFDVAARRVTVWDTASGAKVDEKAVDPVAIRVLASPDGKLIATSNIGAGTISLFDARTRAPVKVIQVSEGDAARQVTLLWSRDSQRIYAAETGADKVAEIDVVSGKVLRRIAAGKNGDGLAIAP